MKDGLISIGEMSEICKVTKRTLRYYDVIGLVTPAYTNDDNGYRYYEPYQVGRIHLVKQMQELGISLDDVATCVREKGTEISLDEFYLSIKKRESEIAQELKTLESQQRIVREYASQYEKIKKKLNNIDEEIHIEYFPKRYLISKCFTGKLESQMFGRTFAEIGSRLQDMERIGNKILPQIGSCYFGRRNSDTCINHIGFFVSQDTDVLPFHLTEIEEGYYATYQFKGEYREIASQYDMLYEYLKGLHYEIKEFSVEIYTLSPSIHLDEKNYITELQIAIVINKNNA